MREPRGDAGFPADAGEHVGPWLDRYRTGELVAEERLRVEAHLAVCAACAGELAELERFAATVQEAYTVGRRVSLSREPAWDRQRREILARTVEVPRESPGGWRVVLRQYAPQAAMAAVALIVLGVLYREGVRGPDDAERMLLPAKDEAGEAEVAAAPEVPEPLGQAAPAGALEDARSARESRPAVGQEAPAESRRALGLERADRVAPGGRLGGDRDRAAAAGRVRDEEEVAGVAGAPLPVDRGRANRRDAPAEEAAKEVPPETLEGAAEDDAPMKAEAQGEVELKAAAGERTARQKAANATPEPPGDVLQRFDLYAHTALAAGDSLDVARALAFWRDSVAPREDLDPARMRAAAALADSLAALEPVER